MGVMRMFRHGDRIPPEKDVEEASPKMLANAEEAVASSNEDTFKTVAHAETWTSLKDNDTFKSTAAALPYLSKEIGYSQPNEYGNGYNNGYSYRQDGGQYQMAHMGQIHQRDMGMAGTKEKAPRLCGMRRKWFWILLGAIVLILIAAIVGGVAGGVLTAKKNTSGSAVMKPAGKNSTAQNSTAQGSTANYSGLDILPNTALAVSTTNSSTNESVRLFWQNGDSKIVYKTGEFGTSLSGKVQDLGVDDAKLFTPIATPDIIPSANLTRIFYLDDSNAIRSKPLQGDDQDIDTSLSSFEHPTLHPESKLAAIYLPDTQRTKIYYQRQDRVVEEAIYDGNWSRGGALEEAAAGTAITAAWYDTVDTKVRNIRVYYLQENSTIIEMDWDASGGWGKGAAPAHEMNEGADLAGIIWISPIRWQPEVRLYGTDSYGEIFEFGQYHGTWSTVSTDDKKLLGQVVDVGSHSAAAWWTQPDTTTNVHLFYQQTNTTINTAIYNSTSTWKTGLQVDVSS